MAKLYYYYSAMNAGKTTSLIQAAHNYRERGMQPWILKPALDVRDAADKVVSRIGVDAVAVAFAPTDDLERCCHQRGEASPLHCVFVDEAQFLTALQVRQLAQVVDGLGVPVVCYGLRTDFRGELFEGSAQLLAWADEIVEIKTLCHCGAKATMSLRTDEQGQVLRGGQQIEIGGNERYLSVCRKHARERLDGEPAGAPAGDPARDSSGAQPR